MSRIAHDDPSRSLSRATTIRYGAAPAAFIAVFFVSCAAERAGIRIGGCLAKSIVGIRCPGCGVTRSIRALLAGEWRAALNANIAGPVVAAYFAVQLMCFAATKDNSDQQRLERLLHRADAVLSISLIGAWIWHFGDE